MSNITKQPIAQKEKKRKIAAEESEQVQKKPKVPEEEPKAAEEEPKAVEEEPKAEDVVQSVIDDLITSGKEEMDKIKARLARLRVLDRSFNKMKVDFGKKYTVLSNNLEKKTKRKVQSDSKPRAKSGFSKPAKLSAELATFMNLPHDSVVSRTEATKAIISYVKENSLESPENRRQWNPDEKLNKLLKPEKYLKKEGIPLEPLGYFNVQRCLSHHFNTAAKV
jgi:chromatin remodeling complex protein RSC6